MNIFSWLVLGHLVGDWMLQNDWMAKNKQNSLFTSAGFAHFTVYTITIVLTLFIVDVSLSRGQLLGFTAIIFISHWLIDATDLARHWGRAIQQSDIQVVRIVVDQSFHLLVLGILVEFFF